MAVNRRGQQTVFTTVRSEGAILPIDLLQRVAQGDTTLGGLTPEAYHLSGEKLNEAINRAWNRLLAAWTAFKTGREKLPVNDAGTTLTRERWLLPLCSELGYGRLLTSRAIEIGDKSYPVSHGWQHTPIHLVSFKVDLDHFSRGIAGAARSSPHSLVQELLNRSEAHMWGVVSNGLLLRILRDNVSLTRQAYVEFDLEEMMDGEVYADFVLLWLLCHQSRVEAERPEACWLEQWSRAAHEQGTRALDQLRNGVEKAITALGSGFLAHPANNALREQLRSGSLTAQDYYRQVLRLVYRLIVLFVAEDRSVLFHPEADPAARERYSRYYATARLRRLAEQRSGTRHADLFCGLRLVMEQLGQDKGCPALGLPALNSFLFSREAIPALADCELANHDLLDAIRSLAFTADRRMRRAVDYKNLGSEELGSVYESLLELHPLLHIEAARFELQTAGGHERKTTGSYYTPTSLITCLLDSALDPVLDEASSKRDPETAILNLKVCDPACGSGHFLIAAAHRIAKRLAAIRTGDEEPAPEARRKALRDVIGRCIYGVDLNPMAVELCKVSLWMEAIEPGKPLSFLEQHIQCGNSLLGATPALLAKGIPDSAFEPIEGDDKKICSEYKKKNKYQREGNRSLFDPQGQQWPWDRLGDLAAGMMHLEEMSDDTVEEVRRKQDYYDKLVTSNAYESGRLWADAWCAAFVWKKNKEFAYPITEEVFRKIEKNPYSIAPWMKAEIIRLREQYQFFHWHLAFPDVFRVPSKDEEPENEQAGWSGGFDVVLGNPPFLGGWKIRDAFGDKYRFLLSVIYHPFKGMADLCAIFFRRAFALLRPNGIAGLVATNTIGQGDTREAGLAEIVRSGGTIPFAHRFLKWSGDANVEVNLVAIYNGYWQRSILLDNRPVAQISSRLDDAPEQNLISLQQNRNKAFLGDSLRGLGFTLEPWEAEQFIAIDAKNGDCLYPYLNGQDLNSDPEQRPSRFVICFQDWPLEKAMLYPALVQILTERVKPERDQVREKHEREYWWLFARYRGELRRAISSLHYVLVRSEVGSHHTLAFVPKSWICSHMVVVFAFDDNYHFALLQSRIHEVWVHRNASTLETRQRYTPTDCFDTFPFPQSPSEEAKQQTERWGEMYYKYRRRFMIEQQLGLTDTYNLFHNSICNDPNILQLRELHGNLDKAILACYGWSDLNLEHDFYPNERGQNRYTISDSARREILVRLLNLNQEIALSEATQKAQG